MKTILLLALVMLASVLAFGQGAPTAALDDAIYEYSIDTVIATGAFDTLTSATDSSTLLSKRAFAPGWEYMLVRGAITGSTDSIKIALRFDAIDTGSTVIYSVNFDSCTAAAGEIIMLPFGRSMYCYKGTIKALAYTAGGASVRINKLKIWKRRPIQINKNWQ